MGNHGPAYYKRYPDNFEKFTPACKSNQLENCTREEISNAYDNAILYTDYFLSKVIGLLKKNSGHFETSMFYVSDHGESLGENGLYLHGLPYYLAPEAQKHVPAIMWLGNRFNIDKKRLAGRSTQPFSHDNLFHTMMGFMEVRSTVYRPEMDILKGLH
jgi:lipid A ethanolaminephosphotransferase